MGLPTGTVTFCMTDIEGSTRLLAELGPSYADLRLDDAGGLLAESVQRHTGSDDTFHLGWSLRMLGRTRLLQRRPAEAREPLERALRLFAASGDVSAYVLHLADFAMLAASEGDVERELRLVGAMRRLRDVTGIDLVDHPLNAVPGLEETTERLGAEGARMLAEGAAMGDEDVVRYALRDVATPSGDVCVEVPPAGPASAAARTP